MRAIASDIMTSNVEYISPETPIRDAAQKMKAMDVGFLPVAENDRLVGALTDRDIVLRVVANGKSDEECTAREAMTENVAWCYDDHSTDEVAKLMADKEIRRLLVLNHQKRLVGVISIGDLAQAGGEQARAGETMKEITEAPPAQAA